MIHYVVLVFILGARIVVYALRSGHWIGLSYQSSCREQEILSANEGLDIMALMWISRRSQPKGWLPLGI